MINSLFFRMRAVHWVGILLLLLNAFLFTDNIIGTIVQVVIAVVIFIHDLDEKLNGVDITKKTINYLHDMKLSEPLIFDAKFSTEYKELVNAVNKLITKGEVVINDEESNKRKNAKKATTAKINKTKEKIQNAINLLRLQGEEVNPYRIAKLANVSYNTARKYFKSI